MGERGKLMLYMALDKNTGGDTWRIVELGGECSGSTASCSGNRGNDHDSLLNHELIDPIPSCSFNTRSNDPITSEINDKTDVNPSSSNLNHHTNDDSSGSSSSSTILEDVTTGDSNYSPSKSDAESSTPSESQVPSSSEPQVLSSSLPNDTLIQDKEDATEINKDKKSRKRKADKSTEEKFGEKVKRSRKSIQKSTTNKPMNERTMGAPCNDTCRLKCYLNIPNETRKQIFQEYWGFGDPNKQRDFISSCLVAMKPRYQ
ncbi:unnamed protein product [Psylliodes chrysocephalus]|uniref:Uncharacterized protein n=1 Tax=Psylliodes chrysocephalus TaxID=3402493 RepID=A0A9P0GM61_9CUCU|nr:unnamed protein product [Psylliodes chrysocephala]